ncbi:aminodeoxychorismate/anthranilate synthase component II [Stappia sp.]|uniref:anthranilate synthase component II n=1 Tax=Stappia sp. TaxID=1870903 RepID=UPI0032D8D21B
MNVLLVDAYDSFVYIIEQYLKTLGLETMTLRCDDPRLVERIHGGDHDFILLGPGPGRPEEAGYPDIIRMTGGSVPILGVCLGHQAIGLAFGAKVVRARHIMHGKTCRVANDGRGVFAHTGRQPMTVCRYHSLIVDAQSLPADLAVTATSADDGYIMGLRHRSLPIEGIQFHPESIATDQGLNLFDSFVRSYLTTTVERVAVN